MSRISKKYTIDQEGLQRCSALGVIDPETGQRAYWQPDLATEWLTDVQHEPGFDRDAHCDRCESYDYELGILPHQLRLPKLRHEQMRKLLKNPVSLPWQPCRPSQDVHVSEKQKSRPGRPQALDGCHMCLLSYLDEVPVPEVAPERKAALQASARALRHEVFRLRKSAEREGNSEILAAYIQTLIERARVRLRAAVRACWDAGFEPWRPTARRHGEDAPTEVAATTWTRPEER